jgi:hypothetical protein
VIQSPIVSAVLLICAAIFLGLAQFRGESGGFVSVELSKDYHGDG